MTSWAHQVVGRREEPVGLFGLIQGKWENNRTSEETEGVLIVVTCWLAKRRVG